jgi:diacylglycerol kinase (ATP)
MKSTSKGFSRLYFAAIYSWQGLRSAWKSEAAIRQEIVLLIILLPLIFFFNITAFERALLFFSAMMVLIVELLNTGLETIVDRIGADFHELSGKAKDVGSAAVLVCFLSAAMTWLIILAA